MNIDTLIKTLESAAELATDGEWHAHLSFLDVWDEDGIVASTPAQAVTDEEAQAIAIRHNTAGEVVKALIDYKRLVELQDTSGHWGRVAAKFSNELKTQRARADRLHDLFLRVSEAAGLELFESPTVVLGEVRSLRARTDEARAIINELAFCIDPNATCDAATELFARAEKYLTEPTPPEATP